MSFIGTTAVSEAVGKVREMYLRQQGAFGFVPNYAKVFCYRPEVMDAWAQLLKVVRGPVDTRVYELATVAAARAIGSSACALAHGKKLIDKVFTEDELEAALRGEVLGSVTTGDLAVIRFATQVAQSASAVSEADIERMRAVGFGDAEIFDIVAVVAARCFFAKIPDALGVQPDGPMGEVNEPLRQMLLVGRPVSDLQPEVLAD
jgi:uncharacterized peroxidase-related enzyme